MDALFLFEQQPTCFQISYLGQHATLHDSAAFVVLDIAHPLWFVECDVLGEALFLEVANRIIVRICEKVHHIARGTDVVFQMRHQMRAISLDLLIGRDSAEDYLGEVAAFERFIGYSPEDLKWSLHDCYGEVCPIVDQSRYVVFGHFGELLLEDAFQASENDAAFAAAVVVHDLELDLVLALFDDGGL